MSFSHGGNLEEMARIARCEPREILDFSANLHPDGFPDWVRTTLSAGVSGLVHYPDPSYAELRGRIASWLGITPGEVAVGNGASELLHALPRALGIARAVIPVPSYVDYERAMRVDGVETCFSAAADPEGLGAYLRALPPGGKTAVLLGNPGNPSGALMAAEGLRRLARSNPALTFVIDEAFIDFADPLQSLRRERPGNVIVIWSWTKILALPGLRMAVALASEDACARLRDSLPTWALNGLAARVMERALEDAGRWTETAARTAEWREELASSLARVDSLEVRPSRANFLLLDSLRPDLAASAIRLRLLREHRIGIRDCSNYRGLGPGSLRVAVRRPEENQRLVAALESVLSPARPRPLSRKRTPALMFQGTGSNVGKSILATALCRILWQDGFKVAPFKAQNMALNSFVTRDGAEIGRAQALQAQAAKLAPDFRMNPVLLKPSSEKGSQVIVNGRPVAHMDYTDYARFKPVAFEAVRSAYDSLAAESDVVVLEGAGSASEVNLKSHEIVNMRMARHAGARVLLVGNIDHGGVFGAMVGTLETMAEWERDHVAGFVINRFRGVKDLLSGGIDYLKLHTGKPVIGVVPHLKDLRLPEEDSLEFKSGALSDETPLGERIDVALIDLPRISNFTDVDALAIELDARVRHVRALSELGSPDIAILGGSKNVATDLRHLRETGIAARLLELARERRTELVGICGGFQMLGLRILDPARIESGEGRMEGLGLLPIETELHAEKTLRQTQGAHLESGLPIGGYEIHHGVSRALEPVDRDPLVWAHPELPVWGTYLHGIFDADGFRRWFLDRARARKGLRPLGGVTARYDLEQAIERLARHARGSLDMAAIHRMLGF